MISTPYNAKSRCARHAERRGVVLIVLLVLFAISMTLFGLWAQGALSDHRRMAGEAYRMQAVRLAESGIERAVARRAADPQYNGETWTIPADELGGKFAGRVRIQVTPSEEGGAARIEAVAEYPVEAVRHAQVTRRREIPNLTSGNGP